MRDVVSGAFGRTAPVVSIATPVTGGGVAETLGMCSSRQRE